MLRVLRSSVGSAQRSPQTFVVIHSRNGRSRSVTSAFDRRRDPRRAPPSRMRVPSSKVPTSRTVTPLGSAWGCCEFGDEVASRSTGGCRGYGGCYANEPSVPARRPCPRGRAHDDPRVRRRLRRQLRDDSAGDLVRRCSDDFGHAARLRLRPGTTARGRTTRQLNQGSSLQATVASPRWTRATSTWSRRPPLRTVTPGSSTRGCVRTRPCSVTRIPRTNGERATSGP